MGGTGARLEDHVHPCGGHRKTLPPGKQSRYHWAEEFLRQWFLQCQKRCVMLTKQMRIHKAKELSPVLRNLTCRVGRTHSDNSQLQMPA